MEHILAFDIGMRRTGVAYADAETGVPLPLQTLQHRSTEELLEKIQSLCRRKDVKKIIIGLPLLPSGEEGAQSRYVRDVESKLIEGGFDVIPLDERYTTPRHKEGDSDAAAACALLNLYLDQKK